MNRCFLVSVQFVIVLFLGFGVVVADDLDVLWETTVGGAKSDRGTSVDQTGDGGYIIAGYTNSEGAGGSDVYLIKADRVGHIQWAKTFGGDDDDWGWSVQQTSDGGYIIGGTTFSHGSGFSDIYLIKADPNGEMQWEKTFGGALIDEGYCVQQTADGGFIVAGHTASYGAGYNDVYLVKTDASGNMEWERTFGGSDVDYALSVRQTSDGGYIACGVTLSSSEQRYSDVYLVKTDSEGTLEWARLFGDESLCEEGKSVRQTSDGGYIITGGVGAKSTAYPATWDVGLIKTDSQGNAVWEKRFGGANKDVGRSVMQTSDGGYIVAGETVSFETGDENVCLIKTDASGEMEWESTVGGTLRDFGYSVQQTPDDGYIVAGTTYSYGAGGCDVYLVRLGGAVLSADAGEDQVVCVGVGGVAQVTLDGSGSTDPAGGQLTYIWIWTVEGQVCDANGVSPTIDLPAGEHVIELTVSNGIEDSIPDQVVITVEAGLAADAGEDQVVYAGAGGIAQVTLDGSGSTDPAGGELTYIWTWTIDGQIYDANGVSPTVDLPAGEHVIDLIVSNGIEDSAPDQVVITVEARPLADAGEDQIVYSGVGGIGQVTLDGSGSTDPAGGELTYIWTWMIDGQTYDANSVSPTIDLPAGAHLIDLIVSNGIEDSVPDQVVVTVVESVESTLWLFPRVVNRYGYQPRIMAWLRLPKGIAKDQVKSDQALLLYPGGIEATSQQAIQLARGDNALTFVYAWFDRPEVMTAVPDNGKAEFRVVGALEGGGYFHGTDTIMIVEWVYHADH